MKKSITIGIVVMLFVGGGIIKGEAFPISEVVSENSSTTPGNVLTIICGSAPEFDHTAIVESLRDTQPESISFQAVSSTETISDPPQTIEITAAVPEPSTLILVGMGVLGLVSIFRRKRLSA